MRCLLLLLLLLMMVMMMMIMMLVMQCFRSLPQPTVHLFIQMIQEQGRKKAFPSQSSKELEMVLRLRLECLLLLFGENSGEPEIQTQQTEKTDLQETVTAPEARLPSGEEVSEPMTTLSPPTPAPAAAVNWLRLEC